MSIWHRKSFARQEQPQQAPTLSANADVLHPDAAAALEKLGVADAALAKLNLHQVRAILKHGAASRAIQPTGTQMQPHSIESQLHDHARSILDREPISDDAKADSWQHYHESKTPAELHQRLATAGISDALRSRLVAAKHSAMPEPLPAEKAIAKMAEMNLKTPEVLPTATAHPHVLQVFVDAAKNAKE